MKIARALGLLACLAFMGCAGRDPNDSGATAAKTITMTGLHSFDPPNATVAAGSVVRWRNGDVTRHTVASDTGVTGFNSDPKFPSGLPSGGSFEFTVPGNAISGTVFYYHCEFHGRKGDGAHVGTGMAGSITVQ
ncbi:MAG TPA: hypothetical protein VG944_18520 [Fimbriimonas sp.]|nr:hypothetical protein [Fimbriimonas sp.]